MKQAYKLLFLLVLSNAPGFAQNMGIGGAANPQYPLDVNGRIRIRFRPNEGAGLWFNKPDNTLGTFIGQTGTGHFGIANNGAGTWSFVFDHLNTRFGIGTDAPTSPLTVRSFGNGLEQANPSGTVRMSTYVGNSSAILQTLTNHPLRFATNDAFQAQMTLGTNGYLGIGTLTPSHPLSFSSTTGNKISLWSTDPTSSTAPHYGLGIQNTRLQVFTPTASDDVVFGTGNSANFTETVRITGDGKVGIGTFNQQAGFDPQANLHVSGSVRLATGDQGAGKILTSNFAGDASWQKAGYGAVEFYTEGDNYDLRNLNSPTITGGVEVLDDDNRFTTGNGGYTVGVTGYYAISGTLLAELPSTENYKFFYGIQIKRNGSFVRSGVRGIEERFSIATGNVEYRYLDNYPATISSVIKCDAGDVITLAWSGTLGGGPSPSPLIQQARIVKTQFSITKL